MASKTLVGERIYEIRYRHADDGLDYVHDFGRGARLFAEPDGSVRIIQTGKRKSWTRQSGRVWLDNPHKGGPTMARRTPPRDARGRFVRRGRKSSSSSSSSSRRKRSSSPRRNPPRDSQGRFTGRGGGRKRTTRRRSSPARRNPPRIDILRTLQDGVMSGTGVVLGKVAARAIPEQLRLRTPETSPNVWLAIQGATSVLVGVAAEQFLPGDWADYVSAGAFAAPLESWLVTAGIPIVSPALAGGGALGSYALGSYLPRRPAPKMLPSARGNGIGSYRKRFGGGATSSMPMMG